MRIIATILVSLALTSCKKDYICTCTNTQTAYKINGVNQTLTPPYTTVEKYTSVKKQSIVCNSGEDKWSYDYYVNGYFTTIFTITQKDCILK